MLKPKPSYLLGTFFVLSLGVALAQDAGNGDVSPPWLLRKLGVELDLRSGTRVFADELAKTGGIILADEQPLSSSFSTVPQVQLRGDNVQVNDPLSTISKLFPASALSCISPKARHRWLLQA